MTTAGLPLPVTEANEIELEAGQCVFIQGQSAENFVVVTEGCITVYARSAAGKEVVLYRVQPGELCILTTACLIGRTHYPADAIAEIRTKAHAIPDTDFERLLNESESFRMFVFSGMGDRLTQVTKRFEHMCLDSTKRRLVTFLYSHSAMKPVINTTHETLAVEVGTAREVISRHLKAMENQNIVRLSRGHVTVLDRNALADLI